MRLFVAVELPESVQAQLLALKTEIPGASWVRTVHLTLRFLGDPIEAARLGAIKAALAWVKAAPFDVMLRGTGRFPEESQRPARVLWVGIAQPTALIALQAAVEQALIPAGFAPEERGFSPHITLARLKVGEKSEKNDQLQRFLEQHETFRVEPFRVTEFWLVSSVLTPQVPQYQHEGQFALIL